MRCNFSSVSKDELFHMLSVMQIKNDVETIKTIVPEISRPVISVGILPYVALFCSEVEKYSCEHGIAFSIPNSSPFDIIDIRSKLKLFDNQNSKRQVQIQTTDAMQDQEFRGRLRFEWNHGLNVHYNLGIFCDAQHHIIGNTQYTFFAFQDRSFSKILDDLEDVRKLGQAMGTTVASVSAGLKDFLPDYIVKPINAEFAVYYKDFNTNRSFNVFPAVSKGKELTLQLLHILSFLNFVRYVIRPIVNEDNTWLMRVTYITAYYAERNLQNILEAPEYSDIAQDLHEKLHLSSELFDSEFRSCMMHYGFQNHKKWSINDEYIDWVKPFYGLVESRFGGLNYGEYLRRLSHQIDELSEAITRILSIDMSNARLLDK